MSGTQLLPPMWTLEQGLVVVRAIQPESRVYGYHVCLGGGVMNRGHSDKDLDIFLLPMCNCDQDNSDPVTAIAWLEGLWGPAEDMTVQSDRYPHQFDEMYARKVKFSLPSGQRIDLFVMKGGS